MVIFVVVPGHIADSVNNAGQDTGQAGVLQPRWRNPVHHGTPAAATSRSSPRPLHGTPPPVSSQANYRWFTLGCRWDRSAGQDSETPPAMCGL
jgi:hypothetical protein